MLWEAEGEQTPAFLLCGRCHSQRVMSKGQREEADTAERCCISRPSVPVEAFIVFVSLSLLIENVANILPSFSQGAAVG